MRDAIKLALKQKKNKIRGFYTKSITSFSSNYSNIASSNNPSDIYESTFANLKLVDGIYCKDSSWNYFPVKVDFDSNIVIPEIIRK